MSRHTGTFLPTHISITTYRNPEISRATPWRRSTYYKTSSKSPPTNQLYYHTGKRNKDQLSFRPKSQYFHGWSPKRIFIKIRPKMYSLIHPKAQFLSLVFFILLTHEESHREVYRDFQPSLTSSAGGAKGWSDRRFCAPPAYTAQLLALHRHRANNQHRTVNQI